VFKLKYSGDAYIVLQTKVQVLFIPLKPTFCFYRPPSAGSSVLAVVRVKMSSCGAGLISRRIH
jgi:hypothetical protein